MTTFPRILTAALVLATSTAIAVPAFAREHRDGGDRGSYSRVYGRSHSGSDYNRAGSRFGLDHGSRYSGHNGSNGYSATHDRRGSNHHG